MFVIGQAYVAVFTFGDPSARRTLNIWCKAPPVLEENNLFILPERATNFIIELGSEHGFHLFSAGSFPDIRSNPFQGA
jgi:hypothetical protein